MGPMLCPCKTEPLHYQSDAPFNQLWNHGKQAKLAAVLIEAGAPVDGLPESGKTPLHGAASLIEAGVAEVLIVNADIDGATALHWAGWELKPKMVEVLLSRGANSITTDQKHNLTSLGWAEHRRKELGPRWGHDGVIQLLESEATL